MILRRILCVWVAGSFLATSIVLPSVNAQSTFLDLPSPSTMIQLSKAYTPTLLNGITVHPENPFRLDFLVSTGDSKLQGEQLAKESAKLVKYFMASLTVPEKDLWVNLSPYEKNRIVPAVFGSTRMGRDLLAQDYILKELASSLTYPQKQLGKEFWREVYQKALKQYGTTQIPVNTFNKIWIIADSAKIYEYGNSAYVVQSKLKVLLEEDLLALNKNFHQIIGQQGTTESQAQSSNKVSSEVLRKIILPSIEKEVNEGENFASLRQVYQSLILATWYKMKLKNSLLGKVYVGQNKVDGINDNNKRTNQEIYERYLKACRKGVFNFIQEDIDPVSSAPILRKYFAGGVTPAEGINAAGQPVPIEQKIRIVDQTSKDFAVVARDLRSKFNNKGKGDGFTVAITLAPSESVGNPLPSSPIPQPYIDRVTRRGVDSPVWQHLFLLGQFLLTEYRQVSTQDILTPSFSLNKILSKAPDFFHRNGVDINREELLQLLKDLRKKGVIENGNEEVFGEKIYLVVEPRKLALWSRDISFIKNDLEQALREEKALDPKVNAESPDQRPLMKVLQEYNRYVVEDDKRPTEAKHPVLIAITQLSKKSQEDILDILLNPKLKQLDPLSNAIALTFAADRLGQGWILKQFPDLVGHDIIIVTPELSTFAGGLGRVMKFFTASLKKLGLNVIVIEGRYSAKMKLNSEGRPELVSFDYKTVPVPIVEETTHEASEIIYQGQYHKVAKFGGINIDGVPIVQVGDGGWSDKKQEEKEVGVITTSLYTYSMPDIGAPKTFLDFSIFFAKAALDHIIMSYVEKLRELRKLGKEDEYKTPFLLLQDSQSLLLGFFLKEFYISKEPVPPRSVTDPQERRLLIQDMRKVADFMHDALAATHTYLNTGSQQDIHGARDRFLQEGIDPKHIWYLLRRSPWGSPALDPGSAGLRTGKATGVAAVHAADRANDEGVPVTGVSNGDFLNWSGEYFDKNIAILYPEFHGEYWEATSKMVAKEKQKAKRDLWAELAQPGEKIDPDLPLISMSQRGVDEKGWLWVFTQSNVLEVIKKGNLIAEANPQPYPESRDLVEKLKAIQREADRLRGLYPNIYKGKFIVLPYDPTIQRKTLAATDAQIHAPTLREKPAAFYPENTGANEMTETNVLRSGGSNITTAYLAGMVQVGKVFLLPKKPLSEKLSPDEYSLGTTLVVNGNSPEDWLYAMLRVQELCEKDKEGRSPMDEAHVLALQVSRVLSYDATTGDYLSLIRETHQTATTRLIPRDINGEVSLVSDRINVLIDGKEANHIGHAFELNTDDSSAETIKMQIAVNLLANDVFDGSRQGIIPEDQVKASLILEGGREVQFKRKSREDKVLIMEASIPRNQGNLLGRLQVTSGLWLNYDSELVKIEFVKGNTTKLGDWLMGQLQTAKSIKLEGISNLPDDVHFSSLADVLQALIRLKSRQRKFRDMDFSAEMNHQGIITKIKIKKDHAQTVKSPGGILLDPINLKIQTERMDGQGQLEIAGGLINSAQFRGLYLRILNITPTSPTKLESLLGFTV